MVGDGTHTIEELIKKENQNPLRGDGYETALSFIPINEKTCEYLKFHNLSLSSIPQN
ncbi:MAG: hypothetical protein LBG59_06095 [Candidatus Peribacteria bacterium]|nr:hypothetical protein [Candidatus Peribacteria bacterium]